MRRTPRCGPLLLAGIALLLTGCSDGDAPIPTRAETQAMLRLVEQSSELVGLFEQEQALFDRAEDRPLTPDERALLLPLWATHIDHDLAFGSFKTRFLDHWGDAAGPGKERALVVGMAAHAAQLRASVTWLTRTLDHEALRLALNEASPEYGVAANHLDRLAIATSSPQAQLLLQLGLDTLEQRLDTLEDSSENERMLELHRRTIDAADAAQRLLRRHGSQLALQTMEIVANNQFQLIIDPLAKDIALWLGDVRIRFKGRNLISEAQLDALQTRLLPGDILVERRNWYLSNLGLPGFWPHNELYVGTAAELAASFDGDPEVRAAFPDGLGRALQELYPEIWHEYLALAADGQPHRILEAVSDGVVFSSLYEAAGADYLGAMRPRLTLLERARAIVRAFSHHGKPYDFDFDFLTRSSLVCSELVYLAYQAPAAEGRSLQLRLSTVLGRTTLPPNDVVAQFDEAWGTPDQQLDFVGFLDGRVSEQRAVEGTVTEFRSSWLRPKWELYQQ